MEGKRTKIERVINSLELIEKYVAKSKIDLYGLIGQIDATEDWAIHQRKKFALYTNKNDETKTDR